MTDNVRIEQLHERFGIAIRGGGDEALGRLPAAVQAYRAAGYAPALPDDLAAADAPPPSAAGG